MGVLDGMANLDEQTQAAADVQILLVAPWPGMNCSGVSMAPRVTTTSGWSFHARSRKPCACPSKNSTSIGP